MKYSEPTHKVDSKREFQRQNQEQMAFVTNIGQD